MENDTGLRCGNLLWRGGGGGGGGGESGGGGGGGESVSGGDGASNLSVDVAQQLVRARHLLYGLLHRRNTKPKEHRPTDLALTAGLTTTRRRK